MLARINFPDSMDELKIRAKNFGRRRRTIRNVSVSQRTIVLLVFAFLLITTILQRTLLSPESKLARQRAKKRSPEQEVKMTDLQWRMADDVRPIKEAFFPVPNPFGPDEVLDDTSADAARRKAAEKEWEAKYYKEQNPGESNSENSQKFRGSVAKNNLKEIEKAAADLFAARQKSNTNVMENEPEEPEIFSANDTQTLGRFHDKDEQLQSSTVQEKNSESIIQSEIISPLESEVKKHDRLLLQGISFISELSPSVVRDQKWEVPAKRKTKVCINIRASEHRKVPYIDALLMSLLTGQDGSTLLSYAEVHVISSESNSPHLNSIFNNLPFLNDYNVTTGKSVQDYVEALTVCEQAALDWCLILDDNTITPVGFINNLEKFVINPLKVTNESVVISLYDRQKPVSEFSADEYNAERAKSNAELFANHKARYEPAFVLKDESATKGSTSALMFSRNAVKQMISSLQDSDISEAELESHISTAIQALNINRRQVSPSLVNHIGYYVEEEGDQNTNYITDVRFQYDAGEYYENGDE